MEPETITLDVRAYHDMLNIIDKQLDEIDAYRKQAKAINRSLKLILEGMEEN